MQFILVVAYSATGRGNSGKTMAGAAIVGVGGATFGVAASVAEGAHLGAHGGFAVIDGLFSGSVLGIAVGGGGGGRSWRWVSAVSRPY